jgi:hypothetical protein
VEGQGVPLCGAPFGFKNIPQDFRFQYVSDTSHDPAVFLCPRDPVIFFSEFLDWYHNMRVTRDITPEVVKESELPLQHLEVCRIRPRFHLQELSYSNLLSFLRKHIA